MDCENLIRERDTHVIQTVPWKRAAKLHIFFHCHFQCTRKKLKTTQSVYINLHRLGLFVFHCIKKILYEIQMKTFSHSHFLWCMEQTLL